MPVADALRCPDDIARSDCSDTAALILHESFALSDDQELPERVSVPVCARARFERHSRARDARAAATRERGRCADCPFEAVGRTRLGAKAGRHHTDPRADVVPVLRVSATIASAAVAFRQPA